VVWKGWDWTEAITVHAGIDFYQISFTILDVGTSLNLSSKNLLGDVFFVGGSVLNTGAE
jgi:hypothetical protein